jgi:hypothetical protein
MNGTLALARARQSGVPQASRRLDLFAHGGVGRWDANDNLWCWDYGCTSQGLAHFATAMQEGPALW